MRYFLLVVVFFCGIFTSQAQNNFRTRQNGDWSDPNTWEEFISTWTNTANIPDSSSGSITIRSFHTVILSTEVIADELLVDEDGSLNIDSGGKLIVEDGTGTDLTVTIGNGFTTFNGYVNVESGGVLENRGTVVSSPLNLSVIGELVHNQNGGTLPNAGWNDNSVLRITGIQDLAPAGLNGTFYDIIWDTPEMNAGVSIPGVIGAIKNDLIFHSTNNAVLTLSDQSISDVTINNNLFVEDSAVVAIAGTGSSILRVKDSTSVSGELIFSLDGGTAKLYTQGDLLVDGMITGSGEFIFNGTTLQHIDITGELSEALDYNLFDNTEVSLGESILPGNGNFITGKNVILHLGSLDPAGAVQNVMTGGNLRTDPAGRTFGNNLTLVYDGSGHQMIGVPPAATNLNVTVQNVDGAELSDDLDVPGDLVLMAGDLTLGSHTLSLNDGVTAMTGYYLQPDSTSGMYISGEDNLLLPFSEEGAEIGVLNINRQGNVHLNGDLTVTGELHLEDGLLILDDFTLVLKGDVSANNGRIHTVSTSGLEIAGQGAFTSLPLQSGSNQLGRLTLDREGMVWNPVESLTIYNWLRLSNGEFNNSAGLLTFQNDATIYRSEGGSISGNPVMITSGHYNLVYEGGVVTSGLELPPATTPDALGNLTVNHTLLEVDKETVINGNILVQDGAVTVDGMDVTTGGNTLSVTQGRFHHSNGTLWVMNDLSVSSPDSVQLDQVVIDDDHGLSADFLMLSGTISGGTGTALTVTTRLTLNGTADQQLDVESMKFNQVVADKTSGDIELLKNTRLLDVWSFKQPANVFTNDWLSLIADTSDKFRGGSIGSIPEGNQVNGEVRVEWYQSEFDAAGYPLFFASPVTSAKVMDLQDDFPVSGSFGGSDPVSPNPSLYTYDESVAGEMIQGLVAYPETDNQAPLEIGKGYIALLFNASPTTIDVTGEINQQEIAMPVTYTDTDNPAVDGWNLVANPYPSAISWDNVSGWDKSVVSNVIAVYDHGQFSYWNGTGAGNGTDLAISEGKIARGEAFWVQANTTGTLTINENAKVEDTTDPVAVPNQLLIELERGVEKDQALVVFSSTASNDYESGVDAVKLDNAGFDLATFNEDQVPLAMNFRQNPGCSGTVGISLGDVTTGSYLLRLSVLEAMEVPYTIILQDHYLSQEIDINEQNIYIFDVDESTPETFADDRFSIEFITDVDKIVDEEVAVSSSSEVCPEETASVIIPSSQSVVNYQLELNGQLYGLPVPGNGSTLFLDIDPDDMDVSNHVRIIASVDYCDTTIPLTTELDITKTDISPEIAFAGGKLISNYLTGNAWYLYDSSTPISTENEIIPAEEGIYRLEVTLGACTVSTTYDLTVTGNDDPVAADTWQIYPNPATDRIQIRRVDGAREAEIQLVTLNGKVMHTQALLPGQSTMDVGALPEGVYVLKILEKDRIYSAKVIIRR